MNYIPSHEQIAHAIQFHGHHCPGLSFGLRAAVWALEEMGRAADEEICVVTETDMCAVDAIQALVGCTLGKGNLIYRQRGKVAFSFYRRSDGKNVRLVQNPHFWAAEKAKAAASEQQSHNPESARAAFIRAILEAPFDDVFRITPVQQPMPETARIVHTVICAHCGEGVMESLAGVDTAKKSCCLTCLENL